MHNEKWSLIWPVNLLRVLIPMEVQEGRGVEREQEQLQ